MAAVMFMDTLDPPAGWMWGSTSTMLYKLLYRRWQNKTKQNKTKNQQNQTNNKNNNKESENKKETKTTSKINK